MGKRGKNVVLYENFGKKQNNKKKFDKTENLV
jgi:hypothetical protein